MTRDMTLIREILIAIEASNKTQGTISLELPDRDPETVSYHVKLLADAGLIEANDLSSMREFDWKPRSLTWSGHEFLDAARNETVWNKAISSLKEKSMSVPFEVLKAVVMQKCREFFGVI